MKLDQKDKKILQSLQKNSRKSLTLVSKEVSLSIDAVHARIKKMLASELLRFPIGLDPKVLGYPVVVDVKVRLKDADEATSEGFISYLVKHPRIIQISSITGAWDFTIVIIAKDGDDYSRIREEFRAKFNKIISDWNDSHVLRTFKFEGYDIMNL